MASPETSIQGVEVFKRPTMVMIKDEGEGWVPTYEGQAGGQEIGVTANGRVVWRAEVYPFFVKPREILLVDIPRPGFSRRVAKAERQANAIASELRQIRG